MSLGLAAFPGLLPGPLGLALPGPAQPSPGLPCSFIQMCENWLQLPNSNAYSSPQGRDV